MRICTFAAAGGPRAGVIGRDGTVIAARDLVPTVADDMLGVIEAGEEAWRALGDAAKRASGGAKVEQTKLLAPIPRPRRNVFAVGWNYSEHFAEGREFRARTGGPEEIPEFPALFSKNPATVVGPDAAVWFPAPHSEKLDWEVELAMVIGKGGRDIPEPRALDHVFGYTIGNDVSVRDVQRRHGGQWFKGKNFDSHLPMGPWIVTKDELDPTDLALCTRVNGVTKQNSRTKHMVFKIPRLVAEFSAGCELWPGDLVITGTPEGIGNARTPPEYLKPGDVVEVEIEGIGVLRNTVRLRG